MSAKIGLPAAKLAVPSIGSITQIQSVLPGELVEQVRILGRRLLPNDLGAGQQIAQAPRDLALGGDIGHGNHLATLLGADFMLGQRTEPGHDLLGRDLAQNRRDFFDIDGHGGMNG